MVNIPFALITNTGYVLHGKKVWQIMLKFWITTKAMFKYLINHFDKAPFPSVMYVVKQQHYFASLCSSRYTCAYSIVLKPSFSAGRGRVTEDYPEKSWSFLAFCAVSSAFCAVWLEFAVFNNYLVYDPLCMRGIKPFVYNNNWPVSGHYFLE